MVIAWQDSRDGVSSQVYAQQVDLFGQLGNAAHAITRVKDIAADQGGKLRIDWSASYLDANSTFGISNYWIWRQAPANAAMEALAAASTRPPRSAASRTPGVTVSSRPS